MKPAVHYKGAVALSRLISFPCFHLTSDLLILHSVFHDMPQKVWLITGCSSGFGAALVREALSRGDAVIATARNPAKLSDLKDSGAATIALDVTKPLPELKKIAEDALNIYGRIDYLINNAGYNQVGGLEESTPEE